MARQFARLVYIVHHAINTHRIPDIARVLRFETNPHAFAFILRCGDFGANGTRGVSIFADALGRCVFRSAFVGFVIGMVCGFGAIGFFDFMISLSCYNPAWTC